jgi:hypothetical protein
VLCTGPSLTQADVDYCRDKAKVVAVSDAIYMAPWADALVSYDRQWWNAHPYAECEGPKFYHGLEAIRGRDIQAFRPGGGHSGTLGCLVANKLWKPQKIILLGADLKGTHFFGPHTHKGLRNTKPRRFEEMKRQFGRLRLLPIVNCTPGSALKCFPMGRLEDHL